MEVIDLKAIHTKAVNLEEVDREACAMNAETLLIV